MVAALEWWSGTECTLYTDPESYQLYGKENAIVVLNHSFEMDFLCGWTFCERFGVLGVRTCLRWTCLRLFRFLTVSSNSKIPNAFPRAQRCWPRRNWDMYPSLAGCGTSWRSFSAKGGGKRTERRSLRVSRTCMITQRTSGYVSPPYLIVSEDTVCSFLPFLNYDF